jgi:hypothetical protein
LVGRARCLVSVVIRRRAPQSIKAHAAVLFLAPARRPAVPPCVQRPPPLPFPALPALAALAFEGACWPGPAPIRGVAEWQGRLSGSACSGPWEGHAHTPLPCHRRGNHNSLRHNLPIPTFCVPAVPACRQLPPLPWRGSAHTRTRPARWPPPWCRRLRPPRPDDPAARLPAGARRRHARLPTSHALRSNCPLGVAGHSRTHM